MIHQIWFDMSRPNLDDLPSQYKRNQTSFKTLNPDLEYKFWSWNSFLTALQSPELPLPGRYKQFVEQSLKLTIEKCDVARYLLLYLFGGLYFDADFYCLRPLKGLLTPSVASAASSEKDIVVLTKEPSNTWNPKHDKVPFRVLVGFMGAKQKHCQFWLDLVDYIIKSYSAKQSVQANTGPVALSRFLHTLRSSSTTPAAPPAASAAALTTASPSNPWPFINTCLVMPYLNQKSSKKQYTRGCNHDFIQKSCLAFNSDGLGSNWQQMTGRTGSTRNISSVARLRVSGVTAGANRAANTSCAARITSGASVVKTPWALPKLQNTRHSQILKNILSKRFK